VCEVWAALDEQEQSNFVPDPTTDERRAELAAAKAWLNDFGERWSALENEDDRFDQWQKTGCEVADLRDYSDMTQLYPEDRPEAVPGRIYDPGFMERLAGGTWVVIVGNDERFFKHVPEAEAFLWTAYAKTEREHR